MRLMTKLTGKIETCLEKPLMTSLFPLQQPVSVRIIVLYNNRASGGAGLTPKKRPESG